MATARKCRYCGEWLDRAEKQSTQTTGTPVNEVYNPKEEEQITEDEEAESMTTPASISVFGYSISPSNILLLGIIAAVFALLPTKEVWEMPSENWLHGSGLTGVIMEVLNYFLIFSLNIPQWIIVLVGSGAEAVLMVALANKVGAFDNKNKVALYILSAVFVVFTFTFMSDSLTGGETDMNDEELTASALAMMMMIPLAIAYVGLMVYSGIRFLSYGTEKYKHFGTYFIVYAIASTFLSLLTISFPTYSVGAKIMNLIGVALDCGMIYFLTASLIRLKPKNPLKYIISYGLIIVAFFVMIFAIDNAFDENNRETETSPAKESVEADSTSTVNDEDNETTGDEDYNY